ncbi:MAG: protein phosphatase CheZ [Alphaproteobacteria bacterium]|nr:protein phosphatase CheZ [Alphaproteobacteria bacterium]
MDSTKMMLKADVSEGRNIESVMLLVGSMKEQLDSMERFVRRRFDEISMEINATSQQLDMAEEGLAGRFSEILNALAAISFHGDGGTAANTGVELEAVIKTTEDAATQIMDAADRISRRIGSDDGLSGEDARQKFMAETRSDIEAILVACSFQDLTGQRIRKILESIQTIEEHISSTLGKLGVDVTPDPMAGGVRDSTENHASSQNDIDKLFD